MPIESLPRVVIVPPGAAPPAQRPQLQEAVPWQAPGVMVTPVPEGEQAPPPAVGEVMREPGAPPSQDSGSNIQ